MSSDNARLECRVRDMCVDFCRDDASVAQEALNVAGVDAFFEEVGGDRVPEHVWCRPSGKRRIFGKLADEMSDVPRRCWTAAGVDARSRR